MGEGADKELLQKMAAEKKLSNLRIFPGQPRLRMPSIIATSDLCLVLLKDAELFKTVIPTKMLEFMSCGRPVVAAVAGEAAQCVERAGGGICVPPGGSSAVVKTILELKNDTAARSQLGTNGRKFIVSSATRDHTAGEYITLLQRVAKGNADEIVDIDELGAKAGGSR